MDGSTAIERISLTVNGKPYERDAESRMHLGDFLRHELGLTGTHIGCEHGVCGACTVVLNGMPVRSCLVFAGQATGKTVTTIEGLAAPDGTLHPLQKAFWDKHGLQCGFCTPGMILTLWAFLEEHPSADEHEIRDAISGNICRCTGYETIVDAALAAAEALRAAR
jgi:carbon-monoxide dehydrogenase small subunit